jgi:O-antigen ligase
MSGLVFRQRSANSAYTNPVDSAAVYRIVLVFTVAMWLLFRLFLRRTHWVQPMFRGVVAGLTVYALYSAVTTIWSVYPTWSLYKACEYGVDIATLAAILATVRSVESYQSIFDWTWTLLGLAVASAWLGILYDPKDALDHFHFVGILGVRLKGVIPVQGANRIGDLGAILALVALVRLFPIYGRCSRRTWYSFLFLFGVASLVLSQTRTAIAGFAVAVAVLLLVSGRVGLRKILTVGTATVLVAALLFVATPLGDILTGYLRRGQSEEQLETLSSRVLWWETAWNLYRQTPLGIGMGAYAAEKIPALTVIGLHGESMHSDYMETILGTGFWGLLPLLVSLAGTWFVLLRAVYGSALSASERQLAMEAIGVLSLLSVRTVFMDIMILHPALHYFVVVGFAEVLRRRNSV